MMQSFDSKVIYTKCQIINPVKISINVLLRIRQMLFTRNAQVLIKGPIVSSFPMLKRDQIKMI